MYVDVERILKKQNFTTGGWRSALLCLPSPTRLLTRSLDREATRKSSQSRRSSYPSVAGWAQFQVVHGWAFKKKLLLSAEVSWILCLLVISLLILNTLVWIYVHSRLSLWRPWKPILTLFCSCYHIFLNWYISCRINLPSSTTFRTFCCGSPFLLWYQVANRYTKF